MAYVRMPMRDYVDSLAPSRPPKWFLTVRAQEHFPELAAEAGIPEYCIRAPWHDARVSIGAAGTCTPIHAELTHNLFAVIRGEKEVALFPPTHAHNLHFQPFSAAPHISPVEPFAFDGARHPRAVRCSPWRALVKTGDVLFIPRGWWHAVRTVAPTIAYTNWWADGLSSLLPRAAVLYKSLRQFRT